ncbi:tetratricopeptide repeat protein [Actinacidiphila sp. ITFR-21]|uniref:tetratricopeptide repeat protein n=1 Tax=Actinacidiphila sp. ITFR-21 TaxID=3075199 RepID=UPI00288958DE|nr:tetratricopeptide repeat protein [Streptomyces sp. ITFR-21]WNI18838.1 tetratricopeptide repeat protein [Streptomyces sp. ITFR-21]
MTRTWEISLDDLVRDGIPHARTVLRLLSCYAADAAIPRYLLDDHRLSGLLAPSQPSESSGRTGGPPGPPAGPRIAGAGKARPDREPAGPERAVILHPLVVETNRMYLRAGTARPAELMVGALSGLPVDSHAAWPRYRMLGVHLHARLDTVAAHLDQDCLTALRDPTWMTVCALDESGAYDAAERLCRAALARVPGPDHRAGLRLRRQLAWELAVQGEFTGAEAMFAEVAARRARLLGDDHPSACWPSAAAPPC